jgi:hypothetical protein
MPMLTSSLNVHMQKTYVPLVGTNVYVDPSACAFYTNTTSVGDHFVISLKVSDVVDLAAWQVKLYFNYTQIQVTEAWIPRTDPTYVFYGRTTILPTPIIDNATGYVIIGDSILSGPTCTGTGLLAKIEFEIMMAPSPNATISCILDIDNADTYVLDSFMDTMPSTKTSGHYQYAFITLVPLPAPFIAHPLNCSLIYGNLTEISVVEMNLASNIIKCTFECAQTPTGPWSFIGLDLNSTDWWRVAWNLTSLSEGNYYIRATMMNNLSQFGEDLAHVYYDPEPPLPMFAKSSYPTILNGVAKLSVTTQAEDIAYVNFTVYRGSGNWINCYWINKTIPKLSGGEVSPKGGCGPTAAAACLAYWDAYVDPVSGQRPCDDIYDETKPDALVEMAKEIAKAAQMKDGGVTDKNLRDGINKYLNEEKNGAKVRPKAADYLKAGYRPKVPEAGVLDPEATMDYAINEFLYCQDVLISMIFPNGSGHIVTMSSVHFLWLDVINVGNCVQTGKIDFMDPATGNTREGEVSAKDKIKGDWDYNPATPDNNATLYSVITVCPKSYKSIEWIPLGHDTDGTDGWFATWDTCELLDGYYLVKATMMDATGNTGTDFMLVYINNARITEIAPAKTVLGEGSSMTITTTLEDQGRYNVTVNVILALNNTLLPYQIEPSTRRLFWSNGDVNKDGYIDLLDLSLIEAAFGSIPSDPNWNPDADLDQNLVVNTYDLAICGGNYGKDIWTYFGLSPPPIAKQTITMLNSTSTSITFTWNTTDVDKGNYTVSVLLYAVLNRTHTMQTTYVNGWIAITILGDINGDFKVDIKDLVLVTKYFRAYPGDPRWEEVLARNSDINSDNKVDIKDLVLVIKHFGEHYP